MSQKSRREAGRVGASAGGEVGWPARALVALGLAGFGLTGALAGCSGSVTVNPVDWWHDLEGGEVADQRPPPPKADAAYPNLSTVPARPTLSNPAQRQAIAAGLVADRADVRYAAEQTPVAPLAPAAPPPPAPSVASASLPAASAPAPAVPAPSSAATSSAATSSAATPLPPVSPASGKPAAPPSAAGPEPAPATMPLAPPPPPGFAGVPSVTAPTPPPKAPPPPPAAPSAVRSAPASVTITFPAGASELPGGAEDALKTLTSRHRAQRMVVSTGGDGAGDPDAQAAALPLALARARAIAALLMAEGVPASMIGISASAGGHDGAVRIAN